MRVAYLMNTYPMPSTTFIRREIHALERQGVEVERYVIRRWEGDLVDPGDIAERDGAHHILSGNAAGLIAGFLAECLSNPAGVARAMSPWFGLWRRGGGLVRHLAYLAEAAYFKRRAASDGVGHVHAHFGTNATAVAMLARAMGGPSYSFTVHGPDELFDKPLQSYPAKVGGAAFVAAISHFCRSQLNLFTDDEYRDRIEIVHCGLNLAEFAPQPAPTSPSFLCVGRLCHQKGQLMIPAAVSALKTEYPEIRVTLIGDGDIRPDLEREIAARGLTQNIVLAGWADNAAVRDAIAAHRIFLLPSSAEGLPVVLMEAYAMARPAISTYIAGIPELIDAETGWLIPAGSTQALAGAMRQALEADDAEIAAKGAAGRARVLENHDIDREAAKLKDLFAAGAG